MASDDIKITIRVGRSVGRFDARTSRASEYFADEVAKEALGTVRDSNVVRLRDLEGVLTRAVNDELTRAVWYAADRMIGQRSHGIQPKTFHIEPSGAGIGLTSTGIGRPMRIPRFGGVHSVTWHPLSPRTRASKKQNKHNFFLHTGALRAFLKQNARSIAQGTGGVRFHILQDGKFQYISRKTDRIRIARLRMTFLPNIYRPWLPGLHSGNVGSHDPQMRFETRVGIRGREWEKLRGYSRNNEFSRPEWHRPLLQPVFTWWTLYRLPRRVASVFNQIITQ